MNQSIIDDNIIQGYYFYKNYPNVYQNIKTDSRYNINLRHLTIQQIKFRVHKLKQQGLITKRQRNHWTTYQEMAVQTGYCLYRGRAQVFLPIKERFSELLQNKTVAEIREKVNNMKRQGHIVKTKNL